MNGEKVVVITLNYNQNDYTIKCIESLLNSEYDNFVVLLVDNGSTEENYEYLRRTVVNTGDSRLILRRIEQNRGYVGGINFGLENGDKLNPDYFLIMNNDTVIDRMSIKELVSAVKRHNDRAIITGKVYHYDRPEVIQDVGYAFKRKNILVYDRIGLNEKDIGQFEEEIERDMLDDVFWLFPARLFHEIGGYSPFFWFNYEQADFALRAKKNGYKLIFTPTAKIWHKGSVSIGGRDLNPVLAYWETQSSLIYMYIHLTGWRFAGYFISKIYSILKTSLKSRLLVIKGNRYLYKYAYAKRQGLYYFLRWMIKKNNNTGFIPSFN